ncbi:MAG TPA: YraN family protein [Alphaproteobacteria bacterium]|nr:YraN family protein [Alphaproteobacteria bacterium]
MRFGRRAELLAALSLMLKGYRILRRRFKTSTGEIDLIARRGRLLIAVEVKARQTLGQAAEAVTPGQRARIVRALEVFIAARPDCARMDIRFDVMAVRPRCWPVHLKDAWRPDA